MDLASRIINLNEKKIKKYFLLLDSHRPINHTNLIPRKYLWIIDDGTIDKVNCPNENEIELLEEIVNVNSDEENSVIEDDEEIIENMKKFEMNQIKENYYNFDKTNEIEIENSNLNNSNQEITCNSIDIKNKTEPENKNNKCNEEIKEEEISNSDVEEIQIGKRRILRKANEQKERKKQQKQISILKSWKVR